MQKCVKVSEDSKLPAQAGAQVWNQRVLRLMNTLGTSMDYNQWQNEILGFVLQAVGSRWSLLSGEVARFGVAHFQNISHRTELGD